MILAIWDLDPKIFIREEEDSRPSKMSVSLYSPISAFLLTRNPLIRNSFLLGGLRSTKEPSSRIDTDAVKIGSHFY
jgi:hypothetical protein